jgi:hypothetical protein
VFGPWNFNFALIPQQHKRDTTPAALQLLSLFSRAVAMTKDYFDPNALAATDSAAVFVKEVFGTTSLRRGRG